ncbi:hypothetical protein BH09ACT5_BH09ACT5_04450 [soil metagenome]
MLSRLGAVLVLAAGMLALSAPAAHADDPVDLDGAYVLDTVGALAGRETEVQAALDSAYERARMQLFVVFVDTFDNPSDAVDWADETAVGNNLGTNDLLLAVAIDDRQYALSLDSAFPLSDSQLDVVESAIEDRLRDSDWAGAAIAGAQALEAEATGVVGPGPQTEDPATGQPVASGGGLPVVLPILGGAAVVGAGVLVVARIRRRRKEDAVVATEQMTQQELDRRAGSLLVQLDDSLKTSEQELGFAVAQFGDAATADFTATLASAKAKVAQAFTLKQQLDDAQPDADADRRSWTTQIIQLCEAADAELDAQADAFDELRQLEKNAPQELEEVRAATAAAGGRRDAAATALAALQSAYLPQAVAPVAENITQAAKLLSFAEAAGTDAQKAIEAGRASEAAIAVRTARASVAQATRLFDAIDARGKNLAEATAKLEAVVADTEQDLAAASALEQDAALTPAIAAASEALRSAPKGDPVASLAQVEKANAALEQVFIGVRDRQEQVARARSQLDASLSGARAQVQSATEYIATRRGGIGEGARTRASEAERQLAEATGLAVSDPVAALREAQQATALAASALQLARTDVSGFGTSSPGDDSAYPGSDGADLGGLLGDWLLGGSSRSSGGGGWSSGGGWFGGGSSRSSYSSRSSSSRRSSRSGSFGGSSRSSGRRSSGGGRSRGGRF